VGISADEGIRVGKDGSIGLFLREDTPSEVFEVHLMDNPDSRGDNAKGFKGLLAPFEELIALAVSFEFILHVEHESLFCAVDIDLDGVIDHEIDGHEGLDDFGIFFEAGNGITHGGKVDKERDAGEVLQDDAGNGEGNFFGGGLLGIPAGEVFDIPGTGLKAVAVPKDGFENDPEGDGKAGEINLQLLA
jgi:hypothetical protein